MVVAPLLGRMRWDDAGRSDRRGGEGDVERRDLALAGDDAARAGVGRRLALRARAPCDARRVVQDLRLVERRVDVVGMRGPQLAGELVQGVVADSDAGG